MNLLPCPVCAADVFPEALECPAGHALSYDPRTAQLVPADMMVPCGHRDRLGCSWVAEGDLCLSCAMTDVTPDLSLTEGLAGWATTEAAKRRAIIGLLRLGWFTDIAARPRFRILAEGGALVMMGHANGVITLNTRETDPAEREARKQTFDEPLRTVVGHVRHELAHFLFFALAKIHGDSFIIPFRNLFGDERADYGQALALYHSQGPCESWIDTHITGYAAAHPHEDWAETAAHVMHLLDLSRAAGDLGLPLDGMTTLDLGQQAALKLNYMNSVLGIEDPYPMVISPSTRQKLDFARDWLCRPSTEI